MTQTVQRNRISVLRKLLVRWTLSLRKVVQAAAPLLPGHVAKNSAK